MPKEMCFESNPCEQQRLLMESWGFVADRDLWRMLGLRPLKSPVPFELIEMEAKR